MALILEFRTRLSLGGKSLPVGAMGTGKVIFFTGVRYERIVPTEAAVSANVVLSRKPANQKRSRPVGVLA